MSGNYSLLNKLKDATPKPASIWQWSRSIGASLTRVGRYYGTIVALLLLLVVCACISLFIGVIDISLAGLFNNSVEEWRLMVISRIPRTISLIVAGAGLSISGLIMQQMTQNKFVSPTTAGALDAAKMGILAGVTFIPSASLLTKAFVAFAFTFLASLLFLTLIERIRYRSVIFIPIAGLMFGSILSSISTFFAVNLNIVQQMNAWMMGDFSAVLQGRYELIYLSIPAIILTYWYANKFTVAGMGKDVSKSLGLNYRWVMNIGLFCVSLTVSAVMIIVGSISFLGLVVPNIISMLHGDNVRKTLPLVALYGAIFLLVCDVAGRLIIFPYEIPIGLMVGVSGGIVFLILLLRQR